MFILAPLCEKDGAEGSVEAAWEPMVSFPVVKHARRPHGIAARVYPDSGSGGLSTWVAFLWVIHGNGRQLRRRRSGAHQHPDAKRERKGSVPRISSASMTNVTPKASAQPISRHFL